jgi:AhpD family alkylhydroperoxidase
MPNALENVAWEPCLIEPGRDAGLETYARRKMGVPQPTIRYFVDCPWLARAVVDLHPEYGLLMRLDLPLSDLIALAVSQENSCRYCYAAVRTLLRIQGMSEPRIQRMEQDLARAELDPRTVAAVAFARVQSRSVPLVGEARKALLEAGFDTETLKEIAFVVAVTDFMNRVATLLALPWRGIEQMPDRLFTRLFRPLIARLLESHRSRGRPTAPVKPASYPYAGLVAAYAGSPIALVLAQTLEAMWSSPHLTRRCKLLMFAVVARGIGCGACAAEADSLLRGEHLSEQAFTQILAHLDAPELDPVERLLVPFARETIWYEPAPLQRRARAVREQLTAAQFLEAVGVLSLANGLCRLGAVLAHDA